MKRFIELVFLSILFLAFCLNICNALTPEQVVVVANKNVRSSPKLAKYYMKKRNIPFENLIQINAPFDEICSREDYEKDISSPVRKYLEKKDPAGIRFHCLVIMYGIPLRVRPPKLTSEEQAQIKELERRRDELQELINKANSNNANQDSQDTKSLTKEKEDTVKNIGQLQKVSQWAAVDSELALVREESFQLDKWLPNRYFLGYRGKDIDGMPKKVIMVSRLDAPTEKIVYRIIDESLEIEKDGLRGIAYFDARWQYPGEKDVTGYAFYDRAIHNAARIIEKSGNIPVMLDFKQQLFQPGQCPDAVLYCGWYSLANYVDAFTWAKGAVGFHIASSECATLKKKESRVWCKVMLEKGVAATIGPVAEPYVESFPLPDIFFGLLVEGNLTLAECYTLSLPFWSWQMILIGDPLYYPFKKAAN
ncbi:TIGR03790 family protein [bacterium]|nr:TIGR03790 family protein [bacterium]